MNYLFHSFYRRKAIFAGLLAILLCSITIGAATARWSVKLDGDVRYYQTTELGVIVVGTEKSLYGVDAETGEVMWRRKDARFDENQVAPVPGTDILLLTRERGDKTRLEAIDLMTGDALWQSEKVRGAVMQLAYETRSNLLAVVLARDVHGRSRTGFKKRPTVHVFDLATGKQMWDRKLDSEIEMMPMLWGDDKDKDAPYTLDNYRPPVFLDGNLYVFYEGVTAFDAMTGDEQWQEKFRVNEEGLALTEADPVADERFLYFSGRGRVRAISRKDGKVAWEAKDLGLTPEMVLTRNVLFVRTGGRFTRLNDGELVERGPYGVSAIDVSSGKVLWRYKGADKGITNLVLSDSSTVIVADRDDLIFLDTYTGKRRQKVSHGVERAAFVLINEKGEAVIGGREEIAAFDAKDGSRLWSARHEPPGRGIFRTALAVAARAASLYFRYGGTATTVFRGYQLFSAANSLRWSGIVAHATSPNLTSLAANLSREYVRERFSTFGVLAQASRGSAPRSVSLPRPSIDVEERLLDRLDPATQLERLSRFLWRRRSLAALRGQWMYFYTSLKNSNEERGLVGVNINTGSVERAIPLRDPDERFISDEATDLLYVSKDKHLLAHPLNARK